MPFLASFTHWHVSENLNQSCMHVYWHGTGRAGNVFWRVTVYCRPCRLNKHMSTKSRYHVTPCARCRDASLNLSPYGVMNLHLPACGSNHSSCCTIQVPYFPLQYPTTTNHFTQVFRCLHCLHLPCTWASQLPPTLLYYQYSFLAPFSTDQSWLSSSSL